MTNFDNKCIALDEPTSRFLASLKQRRERLALTRKHIAGLLRIGEVNIFNYENGIRKPSVKTLMALAALFYVDLSDSINYKLFHGLIKPQRLRELFHKFGFNYSELARLTGYCNRSVKDCLNFDERATPQCIAAIIDVLENERLSCSLRDRLMKKGRSLKKE